MKIRNSFVSNSSSASFIVKIKSDFKDLINPFFENLEFFTPDGCLDLLAKKKNSINFFYEFHPTHSEEEKIENENENKRIDKLIKEIENYKKPDFLKIKGTDIVKEEIIRCDYLDFKKKIIKISLDILNWTVNKNNKGYISINAGSDIIYNGWENIKRRKELIQLVSFLSFMNFDFETEIINEVDL